MSDTPDSPDTDMAGNGERVPGGPDAIPDAKEQAHAVEHREHGHDMETDDSTGVAQSAPVTPAP